MVSSVAAHSLAREAEHLAQDQRRALVRRQVLERGDERELDALALLVARLGRGVAVLERRASRRGSGSTQTDSTSGSRGPVVRVGGGAVVDRQHPLRALRDRVQRGVGGDRVEPRAQRAAALEPRQRPARRAAASPGARPRRRGPSRASGSSAPEARRGRARPGARRRPRRRPGRARAGRVPRSPRRRSRHRHAD